MEVPTQPQQADPRMNLNLMNEQETRIKEQIINPSVRSSDYFKDLTKDLRLGNISANDKEWFREMLNQTKSLCDLYRKLGVPEQADMLWSEFMAQYVSTASDQGWQGEHLGGTTSTSKTEYVQRDTPATRK